MSKTVEGVSIDLTIGLYDRLHWTLLLVNGTGLHWRRGRGELGHQGRYLVL